MADGSRRVALAAARRRAAARLSGLAPPGLRWRLTAWVAAVLLVASAITFVAIYRGTGSELSRQIDRELRTDADAFTRHLASASSQGPAAVASSAEAYVRAQPFHATSHLLFVSAPGAGAVTNEPELFGLARGDDREPKGVQARESRLAHALLVERPGYSTVDVADAGDVRVLIVPLRLPGGAIARVGAGEPLSSVRQAQSAIVRAFLLAAALTLVAAVLASYLVGARVTRPLRRMARIAARVDGGDLAPRIHASGGRADEVRVLADSFDRMLDRLSDAFARQRSFVADASHELRTPLTVIRGQLEVLAREENPSGADVRRVERLVQGEVSRMSRLVDELLLLAHSDESEFLRREEIELERYVPELWEGIRHTAERDFDLRMETGGVVWADPDRLAQALRNLLRNAIEHTDAGHGRVRLAVEAVGAGAVRFSVQDDGPGIPADQRGRIFDRFHRTDAARNRAYGGTGLGLAIVQAIVDAHGGSVAAKPGTDLGGARVEIELPAVLVRRPVVSWEADAPPASSRTPAATAGLGRSEPPGR
jgi:signal transduction histidine kinase